MVRFKKTPLKLHEMSSFRHNIIPTTSNHADEVRPTCVISTHKHTVHNIARQRSARHGVAAP